MRKLFLLAAVTFVGMTLTAQKESAATPSQYLLIFRFKANFVPPSGDAVQKNIQKWQAYMGGLGQSGKLVKGFRPAGEGITISGAKKEEKAGAYVSGNELISSFIIIKAASMDEANKIAKDCPIFEFDGSVEIRPLMDQAG